MVLGDKSSIRSTYSGVVSCLNITIVSTELFYNNGFSYKGDSYPSHADDPS